ncbi:hypothetical protein AM10699_59730 (plasmid) [Acaryochloris marina MBIC10699]|nr:hypothetical protein AM10699_59730 [Acaryochloris marina MBIC10699]
MCFQNLYPLRCSEISHPVLDQLIILIKCPHWFPVLDYFCEVRARMLNWATGMDGTDEEAFSEVSTEAIALVASTDWSNH